MNQLRIRAANTRSEDLGQLRLLLIQAGQLEQAVEDCLTPTTGPRLRREVCRLSDSIATAFVSTWSKHFNPGSELAGPAGAWAAFASRLEQLKVPNDISIEVKVPEGFEYYALYPEHYCVAAMAWATERGNAFPKCALVLGIRSIGTTLSAVVAAWLRSAGWEVERATVRPMGHAFARRVELPNLALSGREFALVVDEGPGLSGSSMAGAARALTGAGYRDIALLSGHGREPGTAASPEVRRWWKALPRYWSALEQLRWNGCSLPQLLAHKARSIVSIPPPRSLERKFVPGSGPMEILDASAGRWRGLLYGSEADWPAAATRFERMKYLCRFGDKSGILWKFAGLGCCGPGGKTASEVELERITARQKQGFVQAPLDNLHGFVALPWLEGKPLCRKEGSKQVLKHIGNYLAASAGPEMSCRDRAPIARLEEMLRCNVKETFKDGAVGAIDRLAHAATTLTRTSSYTDGRMAPHEWIRTTEGHLLKTDYFGHVYDHTLVGTQSLLWDAAGALVEWDIPAAEANLLLDALPTAGARVNPDGLKFYQAAYAAFRLGVFSLCADQAGDEPIEQGRLLGALSFYRAKLGQLLNLAPAKDRTSG